MLIFKHIVNSDKLHIHFCKYILGANKTSTNFAILSELGRISFALDCFTSVFKYWYRLDSSTNFVAVGRQSAIHTENSGFASPTVGQHISTFRGYRILFSIINPYINRFTNHFSIHS
jgi:hypothetical protein